MSTTISEIPRTEAKQTDQPIRTIDDPAMWKRFYDENGYLVVKDVLSPAEIDTIRASTDRLIEQARGLTKSTDAFMLEPAVAPGKAAIVKRIFDPIALDEFYMATVRHPRIVEVLTRLIGPDVQFHHSKAHLKQPLFGSEITWHQDFPFFPHTNFDLVGVMIAIDQSTVENGCLRVVPGSHKWLPEDHKLGEDGWMNRTEEQILSHPGARIENVQVPAGGISVHHCLTFHSSLPNRSTKPRRSLIHQYRAADNVQLGGRTNHAGYGTMVAGEDRNRVRMVAAEFALPAQSTDPRAYLKH